MAAILVRPPAFTLADERTVTAVIGKVPIKPAIVFPIPCATNSLFVGETLFIGSILSAASKLKSVSNEATIAIVLL